MVLHLSMQYDAACVANLRLPRLPVAQQQGRFGLFDVEQKITGDGDSNDLAKQSVHIASVVIHLVLPLSDTNVTLLAQAQF